MIGRSLNADLRKMKGTSVILAHLLIPIITSVIFLIYYFFSPWNENMKVIAFYQAIGAGLPVAAQNFCHTFSFFLSKIFI